MSSKTEKLWLKTFTCERELFHWKLHKCLQKYFQVSSMVQHKLAFVPFYSGSIPLCIHKTYQLPRRVACSRVINSKYQIYEGSTASELTAVGNSLRNPDTKMLGTSRFAAKSVATSAAWEDGNTLLGGQKTSNRPQWTMAICELYGRSYSFPNAWTREGCGMRPKPKNPQVQVKQ